MLMKLPKVGEFVKVLRTGRWDDTGDQYQTKGAIHEIEGVSDISEAVYFIGNQGNPIFIDEYAFNEYELYDEELVHLSNDLLEALEVMVKSFDDTVTPLERDEKESLITLESAEINVDFDLEMTDFKLEFMAEGELADTHLQISLKM